MAKIQMAAMPSECRVPSRKPVEPIIAMPSAAKTKIAVADNAVTAPGIDHVFVCASGTFKMSAG